MSGKQIQHWPAWYFGPSGESKICHSISDIPDGWRDSPDHPDLVAPPAAPPPDGPNAWAGHTVENLIHSLRKCGETIRAYDSPRKMFERAVALGAIPGYGKPDDNK